MNILVRLPNWLGDMVMSTAFLQALRSVYPAAQVDVIVKKGLEQLTGFIPAVSESYVFSQDEWKGLQGAYRFGRSIKKKKKYDLFFCLPDSFSSAIMAFGTGATTRIGFKKELRSFLLTKSFTRPDGIHRVEEYISLLQQYIGQSIPPPIPELTPRSAIVSNRIILNFNSEAGSRRMPVEKAVSIFNELASQLPGKEFICIGAVKEKAHIDAILQQVDHPAVMHNKAGETKNIQELTTLIGTGAVMLSTDSGPAHIANALGVPLVVLFGAGNENNTAPYNSRSRSIIRLGQLPCEPCVKNTCIYGLPKCLELLDENRIVTYVKQYLAV